MESSKTQDARDQESRQPQSEARQALPELCNIQEAEQEVEFHRLESSKTQEPMPPPLAPCYAPDVEEEEFKRPHSSPCIAQDNKKQGVKHSQSVPCIVQNIEEHGTKVPKSVPSNVEGVEEKEEKLPQLAPSNTKDIGGQFETFVEEQGTKNYPSEATQDFSNCFTEGFTRKESKHCLENQSSELLKMLKEAQLAFERETAREEKLASQGTSNKVEDLKGENRPIFRSYRDDTYRASYLFKIYFRPGIGVKVTQRLKFFKPTLHFDAYVYAGVVLS